MAKSNAYKPLQVCYDDGTVVNVGRCSNSDMPMFMAILERLAEAYAQADAEFASLIINEDVVADLKSACSFLPIVGKSGKTGEFLDFSRFENNYEQIVSLFFNGTTTYEENFVNVLTQPEIATYHFFNHVKRVLTEVENMKKVTSQKEN